MRKAIMRITNAADNVLLFIASILLLIASLLSVVNAILRAVGLGGFTWSDEASVILLIFMVFLSQPFLEYNEKQLSISILTSSLKTPGLRKAFHIIRGVFIIGIIGYLIPYSIKVTSKALSANYVTSVLKLPRYILYISIVVSFILIVVNWIITLFTKRDEDLVNNYENKEEEDKKQ